MSVVRALEAFIAQHRECGPLTGDAAEPVDAGYPVWVACACGARWERWVTPAMAHDDPLPRRPLTGPS